MAQQTINIGANANDGTGDPLRTAFDKANDNFTELYVTPPLLPVTFVDDADRNTTARNVGTLGFQLDTGQLYWSNNDIVADWVSTFRFGQINAVNVFASSGMTFGTELLSQTPLASPSAFTGTGFQGFASTVNGAALMGYGTTYDASLLNRSGTVALGVTANTVNVVCTGNLNGAAVGYHASTRAWIATLGSTPADVARIDRFFRALETAGLLDELSDGCFLRTGQNTGTTTPKTLLGGTFTLDGTPIWSPDGIGLNGSTQRGKGATTAVTAHTMFAEMAGASGQTSDGQLFGVINSAGLTTAASALGLSGAGAALGYTRQGGAASLTNAGSDATGTAFTVHYYNPLQQNLAVSNDNAASPTVKVYVDGFNIIDDSSANTQATSALNTVTIGARFLSAGSWDIHYKGRCANWLLFNRVLTAAEIADVHKATRHLNPRPVQMVVYGDSLTTQLSDATRAFGSWGWKLNETMEWAGRARLCNPSVGSGAEASSGASGYASRVSLYKPLAGSAEDAYLFVLYGTNDTINSVATATTIANLQTIWRAGRADGFRVIGITIPAARAGIYSGTQNTNRATVNAAILAAVGTDLEAAIDLDAFISSMVDTSFYVDNYHPSPEGYAAFAEFIVNGLDSLVIGNAGTVTAAAGAATLNTQVGVVTTEALTTAGLANYTLTLTNSKIVSTSRVFATVGNGTNTAAVTVIRSVTEGSGSVVIVIGNTSAATPLNGTLKVKFFVL